MYYAIFVQCSKQIAEVREFNNEKMLAEAMNEAGQKGEEISAQAFLEFVEYCKNEQKMRSSYILAPNTDKCSGINEWIKSKES